MKTLTACICVAGFGFHWSLYIVIGLFAAVNLAIKLAEGTSNLLGS